MSINDKVHSLENDSDTIVHKVRKYLVADFLPPIDREDIGLLLHKLDKYIDLLKNTAGLLNELFGDLNSFKNKDLIIEQTIKIGILEESADRCFEESIYELYKKEKNAIEVMKWTKIYNGFEYLFDAYENVSDTIEDIIIKNS